MLVYNEQTSGDDAILFWIVSKMQFRVVAVHSGQFPCEEPMPKRKEPELKPEEQFRRFQETAKELELDETGKPLEDAFKSLRKQRGKPNPQGTPRSRE